MSGHVFDSKQEEIEAKRFKELARIFDKSDSADINQMLSLLAILCEQKVRILKQLDQLASFDPTFPVLERKVVEITAHSNPRHKETD